MSHAHLVQFDIAWEDKTANHQKIRAMLAGVDVAPGDLIALPEMFDTGFSMNTDIIASDPEHSYAFLRSLAREYGAWVLASTPVRLEELEPPRDCVNRAIVCDPDGELALECEKVHPFSFGREPERFVGGDEVEVVEIGGGAEHAVCCPVVCYDLRFPEVFRAGVDGGAELFVVIANWPRARQEHWRQLLIARAIENQAIVLGLNRCGSDPHLAYAGGSIAVGPTGDVLVEAGHESVVLSLPLEMDTVRRWRDTFPALRDRRRWSIGPDADNSPPIRPK